MSTHIALLRGINLGNKNKLPMRDLVAIFEDCGARDVRTYIQSGNVVYRAAAKAAARMAERVTRAIRERHGLDVPVVQRTRDELVEAIRENPYATEAADPKAVHLAFLAERPSDAAVAALDPARSPPDTFVVRGREIYLHFPNGLGRSKLTNAYFDKTLGTVSTMRNWRTVLTLAELASS